MIVHCRRCDKHREMSRVAYLPFMEVREQAAIPPWFPVQGPVAVQEVKLVKAGAAYEAETIKGRQELDKTIRAMRDLLQLPEDARAEDYQDKVNQLTKAELCWYKKNKEHLKINDKGVLCVVPEQAPEGEIQAPPAVVLPDLFRFEAIEAAHEGRDHPDRMETMEKVKRRFDWPGMRLDVIRHIDMCPKCTEGTRAERKMKAPWRGEEAVQVGQLINLDFIPVVLPGEGPQGILVMVDHFSKYCIASPIKELSIPQVLTTLVQKWVPVGGFPHAISSSLGADFEDTVLMELCKYFEVTRARKGRYHESKTTQGGTLARDLWHIVNKLKKDSVDEWQAILTKVVFCYNVCENEETEHTPFRLWTGKEAHVPLSLLLPRVQQSNVPCKYLTTQRHPAGWSRAAREVRLLFRRTQRREVRHHDKRVAHLPPLIEGQFVMYLTDATRPHGRTRRLTRKWIGPLEIMRVLRDGHSYVLEGGRQVPHERVRLHHPRMHELKKNQKENYEELRIEGEEAFMELIHAIDTEDDDPAREVELPKVQLNEEPRSPYMMRKRKERLKPLDPSEWSDEEDEEDNPLQAEESSEDEDEKGNPTIPIRDLQSGVRREILAHWQRTGGDENQEADVRKWAINLLLAEGFRSDAMQRFLEPMTDPMFSDMSSGETGYFSEVSLTLDQRRKVNWIVAAVMTECEEYKEGRTESPRSAMSALPGSQR